MNTSSVTMSVLGQRPKPKTDEVTPFRLGFVSGHPPTHTPVGRQEVQVSCMPKAGPLVPSGSGSIPGHEAEPQDRIKSCALPSGRSHSTWVLRVLECTAPSGGL